MPEQILTEHPALAQAVCPGCQAVGTLRLSERTTWVAKPLGTYSLSGMQTKASVTSRTTIWLVCTACPFEEEGKSDA